MSRTVRPLTREEFDKLDDDWQDRQLIYLAMHRRECHVVSHRECKGFWWKWATEDGWVWVKRLLCTPEKCSHCKDEKTAAWNARNYGPNSRNNLTHDANELLRRSGAPKSLWRGRYAH